MTFYNLKMCEIFSSKSAKRKIKCKEFEPPPKKLVSEGEILLKELSEKQLSIKTTLERVLNTNQQFERSTEYSLLSNLAAGTSSRSEFELVVEKCKEVKFLKSKGLTDFDLQLYIDYKNNSIKNHTKTKYKNIEETVLQDKIKFILSVVENVENSSTSHETIMANGNLGISRHENDYLCAIKPNSIENKLLKFSITNQSKKQLIPKDIDHIIDIEKEFVQDLDIFQSVDTKQIQKRARKLGHQIEKLNERGIHLESPQSCTTSTEFTNISKWDIKEIEKEPQRTITEKKLYQCKELNLYTIKNGEIVKLQRNHDPLCESTDTTKLQKLSTEEIKAIERFKNYEPGTPTNNLYLKNLSNKITESDLSRIFEKFNSEILSINVLKGKLRGQAFVKFKSEQTASNVLEEINGTVFKNKPIIIQFGKSSSV